MDDIDGPLDSDRPTHDDALAVPAGEPAGADGATSPDEARPAPGSDGGESVSIDAAGGGPVVDEREHAVDPRSITHARIVGMSTILALSLVPLFGITLGWALGGVPGFVYLPLLAAWTGLVGSVLLWAFQWPRLHHRHLRYRLDRDGMRIRRGVLWRKVITIPASRVQHTDVSQGPLQRQFELATLTVYTAGTEGASIALSGLEQQIARRLRDHLLPEHRDDDARA